MRNWIDDIEHVKSNLLELVARADVGVDTNDLVAEALEELAVTVEELQAQNQELVESRLDLETEQLRYRYLFDAVPDGYVVTDRHGVVREANATAAELFDIPARQLKGRALGSMIEPVDRRAFYVQLGRVRNEEPGAVFDINLTIRDGEALPANLRAVRGGPGSEDDDEIRWLIHDRRPDLARSELRSSEDRLRRLFESALVGIVLTDAEGSIVFTNQYADDLLGRAGGTVALDDWLGAVPADQRPTLRQSFDDVLTSGRAGKVRHQLTANGAVRTVDHGVSPLYGLDRRLEGAVSAIVDVTEEEVAKREAEEGRDFTKAIIDTVGALVIALAPDGRVELFNRACEAATGLDAASVIGRRGIEFLVPEEQRAGVERMFEMLIETGDQNTHENDWMTSEGERRRIAWTNTAVRDADGSLRVILGTGIDVTETRRLEQRLAQVDRLESIGRIAAGLAHDFNNTLSALELRLDRLARRSIDGDAEAEISAMRTTIGNTQDVVRDLVSFSGRQLLTPRPVDVNAEIRRTVDTAADLLPGSIKVDLDLDERLVVVDIDPWHFEQAIVNLLINASDAMPDGGEIGIITRAETVENASRIAAELRPGRYARITVADHGVGIEPHFLSQIFDPYFTTKSRGRGTGLGLATTHGTITQSGGSILVDSRPGEGSAFTLLLPILDPPPDLAPPRRPAPSVLVVEDDTELASILLDELQTTGHRVVTARSGEEALELPLDDVDLVVTDVELPGIHGVELAQRIEKRTPAVRTLFISGAAAARLERLVPPGAFLLKKPFTVDQFHKAIAQLSS